MSDDYIPVTFTPEGIAKSELMKKARQPVKTNWYGLLITSVAQEQSKDKTSMNVVLDFEILNEGEFIGIPIRYWINEKAVDRLENLALAEALLGEVIDRTKGKSLNFGLVKSKKVDGMIMYELSSKDGKMYNVIKDFRPYTGS